MCRSCSELQIGTTTNMPGANSTRECACAEGRMYWNGQCKVCSTTALICPGGHSIEDPSTDTTPLVAEGFMTVSGSPLHPFTCIGGKVRCPGQRGVYNATAMCVSGFDPDVPQCARCMAGFTSDQSTSCKQCVFLGIANFPVIMRLMGVASIEMLAVAYMYLRWNKPRPSGKVTFTLSLNFLQSLHKLMQLPLAWESLLLSLNRWTSALLSTSGILGMFGIPVDCLSSNQWKAEYAAELLVPAFPVFIFCIAYMLGKLCGKPLNVNHVINTICIIFKSLFISLSGLTLKLFVSQQMPNGKYMVREIPQLEYGSKEWLFVCPLAVAAFCAYCGIFIAFVTHATVVAPKRAAMSVKFTERYRFAFGALRPDRWWWAEVHVLYSLCLVVIQVVASDVHIRIYLSIFLLMTVLVLEFQAKPFKFHVNTQVDLSMSCSLLVFLVISTTYIDTRVLNENDLAKTRQLFAWIAVIILCAPVAYASVTLFSWLRKLLFPKLGANARAMKFRISFAFRDVAMRICLLSETSFLKAMTLLGESDLRQLQRAVDSIVAIVMKMQPGDSLARQRIMPGVEFKVWDHFETTLLTLEDISSGRVQEAVMESMTFRTALLQLATDLRVHTEHSSRSFSTTLTRKSSCVQFMDLVEQHGLDGMVFEDFHRAVARRTNLSHEELETVFRCIDSIDPGKLSFLQFVETVVGAAPRIPLEFQERFAATREFCLAARAATEPQIGAKLQDDCESQESQFDVEAPALWQGIADEPTAHRPYGKDKQIVGKTTPMHTANTFKISP